MSGLPKPLHFFTLLEWIIVSTVLIILALTAIPQFLGLNSDARASMVQSAESLMRSANIVIYAQAATKEIEHCAHDAPCDIETPVVVNGHVIRTHYGYALDMAELRKALPSESTQKLLVTDNNRRLEHRDAIWGYRCSVTYVAANQRKGFYTPPTYSTNTSNCN